MTNLLLEQYARYKKTALERSPYSCLLNADIQLNPHQINAFCAALQALKTGGIILADEVGLGKTIEAGLVLKYVIQSGAKRVLIALPAMSFSIRFLTCLLSRCQCHRDTLPLQSGNVFISATIWPVFFCTQVVQIKKVHSVGWLSLEVLKKWFPS